MERMKVVEYDAYGGPEVLQLRTAAQPHPEDNQVLVKIKATSVTSTECIFRKGRPYYTRLFTGLRKPNIKRLGEEFAGEVVDIGASVENFKRGDRVFGTAGPGFGANAEYICVPEDEVITSKPSNLTDVEAACSVDGFLTALPFLRDKGKIREGQNVLIYGASGSVGSSAVQVAKYYGAVVTAVCSTANIDLVKSIGADHVVDYKKKDFANNGLTYDIIFDAVSKINFSKCEGSLKRHGIFLEASASLSTLGHIIWTSLFSTKKAKTAATGLRPPHLRRKDLDLLKELLEQQIIMPVVDRIYPFNDIVEAHAYVDLGHKKGNVSITIEPDHP